MRITLAVVVGIAALLVPGTAAAAAPANDNVADTTVVDPASLPYSDSVDNTEATIEPGEPLQCIVPSPEKSVWYSITPTADVTLRADTAGSNFSTFLEVFQSNGPGFGGLSGLQCQYSGSPIIFNASAGTTYYFQAAAFPFSGGGNLQFNLQGIPPPPNDDFANATPVGSLPFSDSVNATAATVETGEPTPSCGFGQSTGTVWHAFTPLESRSYSVSSSGSVSTQVAVYTGNGLGSLSAIGCRAFGQRLTFHAEAGTTYYLQAGGIFGGRGTIGVLVEVAPDPVANFGRNTFDPSIYDTVQFFDFSNDPAGVGIEAWNWDFGDGDRSSDRSPIHRYTADGAYDVTLTVTTLDGRTASNTQSIQVSTHDVAIVKLLTPQSGRLGQTRTITVSVSNQRYAESVRVDLYRSSPGGFVLVGSLTQSAPVRSGGRTTDFRINYTFTGDDAALGKVTFRAVATILGARDALPADNEAVGLPTKVSG